MKGFTIQTKLHHTVDCCTLTQMFEQSNWNLTTVGKQLIPLVLGVTHRRYWRDVKLVGWLVSYKQLQSTNHSVTTIN